MTSAPAPKTEPAISVVIPSRNRRPALAHAIASVRGQSLPVHEIIVVDDASTDGTADWLERDHPDIRVIALEHRQGAPQARNLGVAAATGEFVAFLDSDDSFTPDKLARQIAALQRSGTAFSTCGFVTTSGRMRCIRPPTTAQILRKNCLGGTSGLIARKAALLQEPFDPDLPAVQDWELYLRLLRHGPACHIPEPLYHYEDSGQDRITRQARRRFLGHAMLWRRHIKPSSGLGWRVLATHRAGLRMLACEARGKPVSAFGWRLLYRLLAG